MTGCLLLNKNPGLSSFKSLVPVKKALMTPKVCHTGTLDSFARGLMIVLTGRAVKLSTIFTGCDKQYRALLRFGEETDTLDPEGAVVASAPVPRREELEAILPAFTGTIEQAPPLYSAIHINGRRAHELARAGVKIEMKKRPVTIYSLSLVSWDPPHAELEIHCSSGTYIRSLARDLAIAAGSRAHLCDLTRTKVGNFSLDDALSLSSEKSDDHTKEMIKAAIEPLNAGLFNKLGIAAVNIDEKTAAAVSRGVDPQLLRKAIPGLENNSGSVAALFGSSDFLALIEQKNNLWKYRFVHAND
jgi:tRNA pseudouridine55 synthase